MLGALLEKDKYALSKKAEANDPYVEEHHPEVVHDEHRFSDDEYENVFEDKDGVDQEQGLNDKHLSEHGLKIAIEKSAIFWS